MKIFTIIFLFLLPLFLYGFLLTPKDIPPEELVVNSLLQKAAINLESKYKIKAIGNSISMPSGVIKLLGIDFQICRILSKEELRKILIECSEQFLSIINSTIELKPYMEKFPFTIREIHLVLFIRDSTGNSIYHPHIDTAQMFDGKLEYTTTDPENHYNYLTETSETYEEALKALKNHSLNISDYNFFR